MSAGVGEGGTWHLVFIRQQASAPVHVGESGSFSKQSQGRGSEPLSFSFLALGAPVVDSRSTQRPGRQMHCTLELKNGKMGPTLSVFLMERCSPCSPGAQSITSVCQGHLAPWQQLVCYALSSLDSPRLGLIPGIGQYDQPT